MPTLIKATGEQLDISPKDNKQFSLEELQSYVKGYIEIINLPHHRVMVCNEEGERLRMPHNQGASELVGGEVLGDVVVCDKDMIS